MKKLTIILGLFGLVGLAWAGTARVDNISRAYILNNGEPVWLGTITAATAGTAVDNANTATPFTISGGNVFLVQCDAAAFIEPNVAHGSEADTAAVKLQANQLWYMILQGGTTSVSIDPVTTGTVNCKFFNMK